jgi:hypothetical protein
MLWFDPCVASQAVLRLATICNLRLTGNPGFLRICLCLQTPGVASLGRIGGKSPAVSRKTPVSQRLLSETGSITTPDRHGTLPDCRATTLFERLTNALKNPFRVCRSSR